MSKLTCSIDDCNKEALSRGLCSAHYQRAWRRGIAGVGVPVRGPEATMPRFWSMVEKTPTCWLWRGLIDKGGYGRFRTLATRRLAHRFSYELLVGTIPDQLVLDHLCRVRSCVNPAHLRTVTRAENTLAPDSLSPAKINTEKTHCINGHPLSGANLILRKEGGRKCRACAYARSRAYKQRKGVA